nr:Chain C, Computationally designed peptide HB1.6928.2.3 [synthetic construct]
CIEQSFTTLFACQTAAEIWRAFGYTVKIMVDNGNCRLHVC